MRTEINVLNKNILIPPEILDVCNNNIYIAKIFLNRGYKDKDIVLEMLNEDKYVPISYRDLPGTLYAIKRIEKAITNNEKIAIYGDYDVDGVTSTAVLVDTLSNFTDNVIYHVPDRFTEGYGMNENVITEFKNKGISLIITCDCGISNQKEVNLAKSLCMDVIISDHHNIPEVLPLADAIINPKLLPKGTKGRDLSGCAVAYFLCVGILEKYNRIDFAEKLLDLVAMSLIADVVPLNGENRYLLKKGLKILYNSTRIGIIKLFEIIEKNSKIKSEEDVAFQIAPRINAAGRLESAKIPVELLLTKDQDRALELAIYIDELNTSRKTIQQTVIDEACTIVEESLKLKNILVLYNEFWHHGIIGIAAGKLAEKYRKPAILMSLKEDGSTVVGSCRSIEEIDIYELLVEAKAPLLKFGGHPMAAGLSLNKEDITKFINLIEKKSEKCNIKEYQTVDVDFDISIEKVDYNLLDCISFAGPYGEGFEAPLFYSRNIMIISDRKTIKDHHIMIITSNQGETRIKAVKWFGEDENFEGRFFDIVFQIGLNTYKGANELQLNIKHMIPSFGKKIISFSGNFIDARFLGLDKTISKYYNDTFYYEGLSRDFPNSNCMDRFSIKRCDRLVLISPPTNLAIFKELVYYANPKEVVLAFCINPNFEFKSYINNFLGILKTVILKHSGCIKINHLLSKLCIEESLAELILKYLTQKNFIVYKIVEDEYIVYKATEIKTINTIDIENKIKNALKEKYSYIKFITEIDLKELRKFI